MGDEMKIEAEFMPNAEATAPGTKCTGWRRTIDTPHRKRAKQASSQRMRSAKEPLLLALFDSWQGTKGR